MSREPELPDDLARLGVYLEAAASQAVPPPRPPPGVHELRRRGHAGRAVRARRGRRGPVARATPSRPPPAVDLARPQPPTNGFMVRHIPDEPLPPSAKRPCLDGLDCRARVVLSRDHASPSGKAIAMAVSSMTPVGPAAWRRARPHRPADPRLARPAVVEVGGRRAARARRRHPPLPPAAGRPRADLREGADPDAARDGARRPRRPPRAPRGPAARRVRADAARREPRRAAEGARARGRSRTASGSRRRAGASTSACACAPPRSAAGERHGGRRSGDGAGRDPVERLRSRSRRSGGPDRRSSRAAAAAVRIVLGDRSCSSPRTRTAGSPEAFAAHEVRGRGDLVGDRGHRGGDRAAVAVDVAAPVGQRGEAGAADRDLDLALAPGAAPGVGDHDGADAEPRAQGARRAVGVVGQQDTVSGAPALDWSTPAFAHVKPWRVRQIRRPWSARSSSVVSSRTAWTWRGSLPCSAASAGRARRARRRPARARGPRPSRRPCAR